MNATPRTATVLVALAFAAAALSGCMMSPNRAPDGTGDATAGGPAHVEMENLVFEPATLTVPVGTTVTWTNHDPFGHTVTPVSAQQWGTPGSGDAPNDWLPAGATWSHKFTKEGRYDYYCLPHASADSHGAFQGMVGTVIVAAGATAPDDATSGTGAPPALPVDVDEIGADAYAVPPPIERNTPAHLYYNLTSQEVVASMADGTTYGYWSFNEQVPGPMLRVREGDTVTVSLTNDPSSTVAHNIDFHAVTGPGGGAGALSAAPGETKTLTWKALNPGVFVYHCAVSPPPVHIAHGMYGLIVVEPEQGLPAVDQEYYVMQGEFYSAYDAAAKGHHAYDGKKALAEDPTFVVFNGRMGSLTGTRQLTAEVGDTVRVWFGVGGPNLVSSFHVIGEIFDRTYMQGSLTSEPILDLQTTLVPSGGATMVEFTLQVPGDYLLVDHSLFRVLKGAAGILHVTGQADEGVFTPGG